ncbi:MAG: hypothetical protein ACI9UH_000762 [Gammaproteobacteria bacterium]|jgi:hypothetical protein
MSSHSIVGNLVDPQQALLTGMVQNFGITPILNYVDKNLQLVKNIEILDKSLANLRMQLVYYCKINIILAKTFNLIEQAENWSRDTGKAIDCANIVIASRLIYLNKEGLLGNAINLDVYRQWKN